MSNSSTINIDIKVDDAGAVSTVRKFGNEVETAGNKGTRSLGAFRAESTGAGITLGSLAKQAVVATTAYFGFTAAVQGVFNEFKRGLSSVEDFNVKVASSAAFIATFSERSKSGDLVGGFREANVYAGQLNAKLEMIDTQTIASGKDLQVMNETMLQYGVMLDINNQKQVQGFTNIATALKLVTQGQNQDIQMRQEINALLMGQVRATDRLPKLLSAIDPHLQEHLKIWKEEGTLIENVGELLKGFSASTGDLDDLWITVGSTMETIYNRILRGGFLPIYTDLLGLAKELNQSLMDAEGNLTPLAKSIQEDIASGYREAKEAIGEYGDELVEYAGYALAAKTAQLAFNAAVNANPYLVAAGALITINEAMKSFSASLGIAEEDSLAFTSLDDKYFAFTKTLGIMVDKFRGLRDPNTGKWITDQERALNRVKELQDQLSKGSFFSLNEKQRVAEINTELANTKTYLNDIDELKRKSGEGSTVVKAPLLDKGSGIDNSAVEKAIAEMEEIKQSELEMYQEAGFGAEKYFANEATDLVTKAERWKKAGADVYSLEQWLYGELGKLAQDAYSKGELAAGQSMESIQAMTGTIVEQFSQANASVMGVLESMGIKVDELNGKEFTLTARFDGSSVISGVDEVIRKIAEMKAAAASAPAAPASSSSSSSRPSGSYENTDASMSASEVAAQESAYYSGKSATGTIINNFNQQLSRSDIVTISSEQKRLGARG